MADWQNFFKALMQNTNQEPPEFSGFDHEDPENFVQECEKYFTAVETEANTKVKIVSRFLKHDAARWWAAYKDLNFNWEKFCSKLRGKFCSQEVILRLQAKLYGVMQTEQDGTNLFLENKFQIAKRLLPDASESQIITILLQTLKASMRKMLRSTTFQNVDELISLATQIDQDEAQEKRESRRTSSIA